MENSNIIDSTATRVGQMTLIGVLRIPAVRQVILLLGIAAAVAGGFAIFFWSQTPGYTPLYADMDSADTSQVSEALRGASIPFKVDTNSGSILVPEEKLHDARLELAGQGLPAGVSPGMDMMQGQSSFGVSQFMEGARYQYALEAELAKTISHMGAVRDARVHLAIPKQSAFIRDQKSASASVLLQLFNGRMLEPGQASSIVHLVASSVPNLTAKNVTLIDQHGRLLSSTAEEWNDVQTVNQFKHTQRLEESYKRRIEDLLTPLVGPGRVRAEVVAKLDFTVVEETREAFDPAATVVRSEQINEEQRQAGAGAPQGVPGALSNQPPETVEAAAGGTTTQSTALNTSRSATRNFEMDRTISRTRPQSGTIQKLSVAVLVDDSPLAGVDEADQVPLSDADIAQFTSLVKEAVGFDELRGDTVAVVNAAFRSMPALGPVEEPAFWENPGMRDTLRQGAGVLLVLALGFGVVRPMLKGLVSTNMASSADYLAAGSGGISMSTGAVHSGAGNLAIPGPGYDEKVAAARNITGHDPARVAQVVKKWVTKDD